MGLQVERGNNPIARKRTWYSRAGPTVELKQPWVFTGLYFPGFFWDAIS